jgi:hypothetical protein
VASATVLKSTPTAAPNPVEIALTIEMAPHATPVPFRPSTTFNNICDQEYGFVYFTFLLSEEYSYV